MPHHRPKARGQGAAGQAEFLAASARSWRTNRGGSSHGGVGTEKAVQAKDAGSFLWRFHISCVDGDCRSAVVQAFLAIVCV
jgi:hypothetical protein